MPFILIKKEKRSFKQVQTTLKKYNNVKELIGYQNKSQNTKRKQPL